MTDKQRPTLPREPAWALLLWPPRGRTRVSWHHSRAEAEAHVYAGAVPWDHDDKATVFAIIDAHAATTRRDIPSRRPPEGRRLETLSDEQVLALRHQQITKE
ncbi:hypothetical protein MMAN_06410 [Mycobacterium mantenii]|uniref:Uncharacterized protein n=1 Tax=Mycobacterium mantenii TaxID=560555 RepID=A0A1X0FXB9_MYCNT|nr:hypothetical protein [Mycobacterium mantenii]MCV7242800.1 hypothetical protein [Mycobacterium mantenii]ORB06366.1 hypothetical protein BST30_10355 [Mycobacterium mantenii]BBY36507.1 hypothetical protein MMAN_06410 [Mycobacterium mantenii]